MPTEPAPNPTSVAALIEALTPARLSPRLNVKVQAISNMKSNGAIPPRHWPSVLQIAEEAGLSISWQDLVELHADPVADRQQMQGAARA